MISKIKNWWSSMRGPRYTAIFVPYKGLRGDDSVAAFYRFVNNRHRRKVRIIVVEEMKPHLRDVLQENGISTVPSRILLFAHPSQDLNGFLVNPSSRTGLSDILLLRWWEDEDASYEILVAHVCRGAHILRRRPWSRVFPGWISYDSDIRAFLATPHGTKRWEKIFSAILEEVTKSTEVESINERLKSVYLIAMADLRDSFSPSGGDALNLMYFQACLQSLYRSEG